MGILVLPPPAPIIFGTYGDGSEGAATTAANSVQMYAWLNYATITLNAMRIYFGTGGNGHYDLGIYDSTGSNKKAGNLLGQCASTGTSLASATGLQSPALLSNIVLTPGLYWIASWIDNATDTLLKISLATGGVAPSMQGSYSGGPLPAAASSITSLVNIGRLYVCYGLLQNGWS